MADMKIGVVGAAGRMGGAVIRQVTETGGCAVAAASEILGSAAIGRDAGEVAGAGTLGVEVIDASLVGEERRAGEDSSSDDVGSVGRIDPRSLCEILLSLV